MFIYLSKKIAIPNNTKINAIAWNKEDGYIAVGGDEGLLKVLKLDSGNENETGLKTRGLAASSNLSMNQSLEGHTDPIQVLVWNEIHKKLTTSDQNGVIIVWMLYKGSWYEEMINNRKKSTVVGMAWSTDGLKICIIYEDGAVIVGSVDGNRIWGKELKGLQLSGVQWSPDGKLLLFSLKNGNVLLYDNQGNFAMKIENHCLDTNIATVAVVGLDWYNGKHGYMHALCPNLAICFENGRLQLMCNENDTRPVIIDTGLIAVHCSWSHNGSLLAVAGKQYVDDRDTNLVQFYTPFGEHLRTLKVPGNNITRCVWEGGSLRVALAVDSFVYFANIRPDYKWCYFKKTIVFTSCKPQRTGICVSFWDTVNNQCHSWYISVVLAIASYGDHCIIATISDSDDTAGRFGLLLCNTLGTPVDGKYIDMETIFVAMNGTHVVAASKNNFLVWQYKTPKSLSIPGNRPKCRMYHIDDNPSAAIEVIQDLDDAGKPTVNMFTSLDPISCLACSDKCLIIGRESGLLQYYTLPHIVLVNRYKISSRPHKMAVNCNSTRLSVIDVSGVMTVIDISDSVGRPTTSNNDGNKLERKDVWAMCWASDNPQLLAIMEKTRMYIFKGIYPEEPMACSGYICSFNDLEIKAVLLDAVIESPDGPSKDHLIKLEVKSLRDTRQLLEKVGINEASQFIEDNPHPRLWRLLAEAALKEMNLVVAESAFVRSQDYSKVLFVKKLKDIGSEIIRKAHVSLYFKNFDEAEKIYIEADKSDLALKLRQTLGDWFRVIQILKNGTSAPDYLLETAYNATADYFVHFNNWASAVEYYELANNKSEMAECYYHLEDYKKLELLIKVLPEGDPLLEKIGDMFAADAVITAAVEAYTKFGNVKAAINLCITHNRWDTALNLAKKYNITKISDLLIKYTAHLVEKNAFVEAIEVNGQAECYLLAAEHTMELANQIAKSESKNLIMIKKHYVCAAQFYEMHKKNPSSSKSWMSRDLLPLDNVWKGAEAYHFYILAQEQLYKGKLDDAVCTAYKLQEYTDYIPEIDIYALLALTSCLHRAFSLCSKALIKLKALPDISPTLRSHYTKLSWEIFSKNEPVDLKLNKIKCPNCEALFPEWKTSCPQCNTYFSTCVVTGRPITDETKPLWYCNVCNHRCYEKFMTVQKFCVLCHAAVRSSDI